MYIDPPYFIDFFLVKVKPKWGEQPGTAARTLSFVSSCHGLMHLYPLPQLLICHNFQCIPNECGLGFLNTHAYITIFGLQDPAILHQCPAKVPFGKLVRPTPGCQDSWLLTAPECLAQALPWRKLSWDNAQVYLFERAMDCRSCANRFH